MPTDDVFDELVTRNIDYARGLARKFYSERSFCGLGLDDFESAGFFGLVDAARRYSAELSPNFRSFAFLRIQGAMRDLLRHGGYTTRKQLRALTSYGDPASGAPATTVANSSGVLGTLAEVIYEACIRLHLNELRQVTDLSYTQPNDPEAVSIRKAEAEYLQLLLSELPPKEQRILWLKYYEGMTFEEMRSEFSGATRSWLCRIHSRALLRLREKLDLRESGCDARLNAA